MKTFFNMAIYKYFAFAMETLKKKKRHYAPSQACVILKYAGNVTCYFCPLYKTYTDI